MRVLIYSISSQVLLVVVPGALAVGLVEEYELPWLLADVPGAFDDDDAMVLNIVSRLVCVVPSDDTEVPGRLYEPVVED